MFTPQTIKPPTSSDVAHLAGVSRATVSLVLNDKPAARITADTRRRVHEAARQLGYTPNSMARLLAASTVSGWLICTALDDPGGRLEDVLSQVAAQLSERGEDVVFDGGLYSSGAEAAARWTRHRPLAILASADRCDAAATEALRLAGVRALLVYGPEQVDHAPTLVLAQHAYGRIAAQHLIDLGHRRLVYVLPSSPEYDELSVRRLAGAREVAERAGADLAVTRSAASADSLRDWANAWRYTSRPTGIIAFDDRYALAAARALADAEIRCPEDVSIIGADDHELAAQAIPRLSTVTFDREELAGRVVAAFTAMLEGRHVARVDSPELSTIQRESTRTASR